LFLLSFQKGEKTLSVKDLQKALDTLVREIRNYPRDVWESQLNDFLKLFSVFQKDYDLQVHVPRKQLSELIKQCPLVPTLYNMTLYNMTVLERSRLLAEHSVALDEWYHNLKKELLEASDSLSPEEIKDVAIARKEFASGKCKTFKTADEMIADLHKKHQELSGYLSSPREGIKKRKEATQK